LTIWQGDAQDYWIVITDSSTPAVAIDLTGYTAQAVIRSDFNSPTLHAFTCVIPTGTDGKIHMTMDSPTSAAIAGGSYVWNFQLTAPSGAVRTYLAGDVTVYPEVDPPA
jgi:hypothetical protein